MKIVTIHVYPPIPERSFDWCAFYEGSEEGGLRGWGSTKEAATDELKALHDEA